MSARAPDEANIWVSGNVGFGHAMLRISPESKQEHQPFTLDGQVWIAADARIDGRLELIAKLRSAGFEVQQDAPDVELILHSYSAFGESFLDHLIGDFAFALWDGRNAALADCVRTTAIPFLDVVPADRRLAGAEIELVPQVSRERFLDNALEAATDRYDFVIIDTPPSLGLLTLNALTAADAILIPIQCEYYALEGLSQLLSTVQLVQKGLNPGLRIEGVLLTMFDRRLKLSNQVAAEAIDYFGDTVYRTRIPRNVPAERGAVLRQADPALRCRMPGIAELHGSGVGADRQEREAGRRAGEPGESRGGVMNPRQDRVLGRGLSALISGADRAGGSSGPGWATARRA